MVNQFSNFLKCRLNLQAICISNLSTSVYSKKLETEIITNKNFQRSKHMQNKRFLSIYRINKRMQLFTEHPRKIIRNPGTMKLEQNAEGRPLAIICSYLLAEEKHIAKYAELYFNHNFDVLVSSISPIQSIMPANAKVVANDILDLLETNKYYEKLFVHGFSAGGFLWSTCMLLMSKNLEKYQYIVDKVKGQIWDSLVFFEGYPVGIGRTLFPYNKFLEVKLTQYVNFHLRVFDKMTTQHLRAADQMFKENLIKTPALIIVSQNDPIASVEPNRRIYEMWKNQGIDVTWKCFEASKHVRHLYKYREEYIELVNNQLKLANLAKND